MAEQSKYNWIQMHKDLLQYLMGMQDRQGELIAELEKAGVERLWDQDASGNIIPLEVIDPFSFFFFIYKYGDKQRLQILQNLANSLGISAAQDLVGIPTFSNLLVRIFQNQNLRAEGEVDALWAIFFKVLDHRLEAADYQEIQKLPGMGLGRFTEALYLIAPERYICINIPVKRYLKEKYQIEDEPSTFQDYEKMQSTIRDKTDLSYYRIVEEAIKLYEEQEIVPNYWLFQCNPKVFDLQRALRAKDETTWRVTSFAKEIKVGDKVIIWQTGERRGVYALAEVSGELMENVDDMECREFYLDESNRELTNRVRIRYLYRLPDTPILKEQIDNINDLKDLRTGLQGTNFRATEAQYRALEILAQGEGRRYWLFAPGESGKMWDDFYNKSYMAIGWKELGDLNLYHLKDEILRKLQEPINVEGKKRSNDALANWEFKAEIKPGDIIIVKSGTKKLLGFGEVESGYYYDDSLPHYKSCRKVKWIKKGLWQLSDINLALKTLTDITDFRTKHPDFEYYHQRLMAIMGVPVMQNNSLKGKPGYPLNMILFGAPGTGKTYDSIRIAVEIVNPEFIAQLSGSVSEKRRQLTERYRHLLAKGRIVFCTFHQSMAYEDFIEGIKPVLVAEAGESNLAYRVEPGIFKRLCERAALGDIDYLDAAWARLLADVEAAEGGKELWTMEQELRLEVFVKDRLLIGDVSGDHYISLDKGDLIHYLKGKKMASPNTVYSEAILSLLVDEYGFKLPRENVNNYVIILDEINRANVPQVLGELISLIEVDKRSGMTEALEVTLPYSKERFSVPANLYILGTMNTADRSVEALDTALRRRFSFREMLPDYDLLKDMRIGEIRLDELLKTINYRIEALLDKDHCVGHSYFQKAGDIASLKQVFFNEIIPLLQEYFYGNFGRIAQVLGSGFVKSELVSPKRFAQMVDEDEDFDERRQYRIVAKGI